MRGAKRPPIPATFDNMGACSKITGIPLLILKKAKAAGCPAFISNQVHLVPLLTWLFTGENDSGIDWRMKLYEMQAKRQEVALERETGRFIELAEVQAQDAAACSKFTTLRVKFEQEWPVKLAGKDVPECRTVVREMMTEVGLTIHGVYT